MIGAETVARRVRDTAGNVYIELMPVFAILLLVAVGAVQIIVAMWAGIETSSAARTGARIASLGGEPGRAVRAALPYHLRKTAQIKPYSEVGVAVRVEVPRFAPFSVGPRWIEQRAVFDVTGGS